MRRARTMAALGVVSALLAGGCTQTAPGQGPPASSEVRLSVPPAGRYAALVDDLRAKRVGVWVDADFVKAYRAGSARYQQVLDIALALARRPGVAGIKIADELGYNDGTSPEQATVLLRRAVADIHTASPRTKVLIDVVVPELGCLSWTPGSTAAMRMCGANAVAANPGASLAAVDGYAASGVDVINLSAGLQSDDFYLSQATTRDEAMRLCWREAVRRWGARVRLQARKALAHPGPYTGGVAQAEADVHTYVDIPLEEGAKAADIWTWAQRYQGQVVTLTDPGGQPNALTLALQERRRKGAQLWTHMTPSLFQVDRAHDVSAVARQFDVVITAAGTG